MEIALEIVHVINAAHNVMVIAVEIVCVMEDQTAVQDVMATAMETVTAIIIIAVQTAMETVMEIVDVTIFTMYITMTIIATINVRDPQPTKIVILIIVTVTAKFHKNVAHSVMETAMDVVTAIMTNLIMPTNMVIALMDFLLTLFYRL